MNGHFEYDRFYLIDKFKYEQNVDFSLYKLKSGPHSSTIGYQYETYLVNTLIDDVIKKNLEDFTEVGFTLPIDGHYYNI